MVHVIVAAFAASGALWTLATWLVGGFTIALWGATIRSNDPLRPLAFTVLATGIYLALRGPLNVRRLVTPAAIVIALCPAVVGIARNSWTASGADQYAYVSQADLWLERDLTVPVPLAVTAPWPDAVWSFTPHGFRPATTPAAIVPVTAPGLPLMMAGAKAIAGHCAMFLVTPLCGALLVGIMFAIGRRIESDVLGLAAAWFTATSPAMLAMLVSPMSDVPAAAFWALALFFTLGQTPRSAFAGGLAASGAILIRPNLAPLAAVMVVWRFWRVQSAGPALRTADVGRVLFFRPGGAVRDAMLMAAGVVPGCLFVAWVNHNLYGSPLASGYGSLSMLFSMSNIGTNLARYGTWLVESQTPLALAGIAALLPIALVWPDRRRRQSALLFAATMVVVWALYLAYMPYEAWWFLRFMLPSWPAICLGMAVVIVRLGQASVARRAAAFGLALAVGAYTVRFAVNNGAFPSGEGDHRYVSIAKIVEQATEPSAVVFTGQHSGPTRYYAGRTIVRYELVDPAWLDRAVQWLTAAGRRPYFLLEEYEVLDWEKRFAGANTLGRLTLAPIAEYRAPGVPGAIYLFDPARPDGGALITTPPPEARATCVAPSPLLHLR
jgi:hypothetical protein